MDSSQHIYNIFIYSDSTAFPRPDQLPSACWPQLFKDLLEKGGERKVYIFFRGQGAATIKEINTIYRKDTGYFSADKNSVNIAIFSFGIVDCAPRPFTYFLKNFTKYKYVGKHINRFVNGFLGPRRAFLQKVHSYRLTTPDVFRNIFSQMVQTANERGMICVSTDTPLPPLLMEERSPGFRKSVSLYNSLKHEVNNVFHLHTDWIGAAHLTNDGHHFTEAGHKAIAENLYDNVSKILQQKHAL